MQRQHGTERRLDNTYSYLTNCRLQALLLKFNPNWRSSVYCTASISMPSHNYTQPDVIWVSRSLVLLLLRDFSIYHCNHLQWIHNCSSMVQQTFSANNHNLGELLTTCPPSATLQDAAANQLHPTHSLNKQQTKISNVGITTNKNASTSQCNKEVQASWTSASRIISTSLYNNYC